MWNIITKRFVVLVGVLVVGFCGDVVAQSEYLKKEQFGFGMSFGMFTNESSNTPNVYAASLALTVYDVIDFNVSLQDTRENTDDQTMFGGAVRFLPFLEDNNLQPALLISSNSDFSDNFFGLGLSLHIPSDESTVFVPYISVGQRNTEVSKYVFDPTLLIIPYRKVDYIESRVAGSLGLGIGLRVSKSSIMTITPQYSFAGGDFNSDYLGISVGFIFHNKGKRLESSERKLDSNWGDFSYAN